MAQSLDEFIATYTGKANTGDTPENKGECVGLIEVWLDNLKLPHIWGNAKDLLANADTSSYDIITNDPNDYNQFPVPGDIIVLDGSWGNGNGHTGIIQQANGSTWTAFEQNNPVGSSPHLVSHSNYVGVLGWIHPKQVVAPTTAPSTDALAACLEQHTALVNLNNSKDQTIAQLSKGNDDKQKQLDELNQKVADLEGQVSTLGTDNLNLKVNISQVQKDNSDLLGKMQEMAKQDSTAIDLGVASEQKYKDLLAKQAQEQKQQANDLNKWWKIVIDTFIGKKK